MHLTVVSKNYSSSGMLIILIKVKTACILCNIFAGSLHILYLKGPKNDIPKLSQRYVIVSVMTLLYYDQHFRFVFNWMVGDKPLETSFRILIKNTVKYVSRVREIDLKQKASLEMFASWITIWGCPRGLLKVTFVLKYLFRLRFHREYLKLDFFSVD